MNFVKIESCLRKGAKVIFLFTLSGSFSSCYYYKSANCNRVEGKEQRLYRKLRNGLLTNTNVIVHEGDKMYRLANLQTQTENRKRPGDNAIVLAGMSTPADSLTSYYYRRYKSKQRRAVRYWLADEPYLLSQMHVYVSGSHTTPDQMAQVSFGDINRIEVYKRAQGRTDLSWNIFFMFIPHIGSSGHKDNHMHVNSHAPNTQHAPRSGKR